MKSLLETIDRWIFGPKKAIYRELAQLLNQAHLLIDSEHTADAEQACKSVLALLKSPALLQTSPELLRIKASGYFDLGSAYRTLREVQQSESCYVEAIGLMEHLKRYTKHADFASTQLAACHNHLGLLYLECGPIESAIPHLDEAIRRRRVIATGRPEDATNKVYLGGALCNRGHVARELGETRVAVQLYDESLKVLDAALPPCDCGCQEVLYHIIAQSNGHPHIYDTLNMFVRNAEEGKRLCS